MTTSGHSTHPNPLVHSSTMFSQLFAIAAIAVSCVVAQNNTANVTIDDVTKAFNDAKIVPDGTFPFPSRLS